LIDSFEAGVAKNYLSLVIKRCLYVTKTCALVVLKRYKHVLKYTSIHFIGPKSYRVHILEYKFTE